MFMDVFVPAYPDCGCLSGLVCRKVRRDGNVVRESAVSSRRTGTIARCGSSPFLRGNGFRVCRMAGTFCIRGHPFGHGSFRSEAEGVSFVGRVCDVWEIPSRPGMPPVGKKMRRSRTLRSNRGAVRAVRRTGNRSCSPDPAEPSAFAPCAGHAVAAVFGLRWAGSAKTRLSDRLPKSKTTPAGVFPAGVKSLIRTCRTVSSCRRSGGAEAFRPSVRARPVLRQG